MTDNAAKPNLRIHLIDTIAACNELLGETNEDAVIDCIRDSQRRMDSLREQMSEESKMYGELLACLVGLVGNVTKAAEMLGMSRVGLHRHIRPSRRSTQADE